MVRDIRIKPWPSYRLDNANQHHNTLLVPRDLLGFVRYRLLSSLPMLFGLLKL
jgi:hypothetical protein